MTKTNFQKYAGIALASTVVIGGIASAAITPIPVISNTFAVAGQVIKSADINKLAEALNILDARTTWVDVPLTDTSDFDIDCLYRAQLQGGTYKMLNEYVDTTFLAFDPSGDGTKGQVQAFDKSKIQMLDINNVSKGPSYLYGIQNMQKLCLR